MRGNDVTRSLINSYFGVSSGRAVATNRKALDHATIAVERRIGICARGFELEYSEQYQPIIERLCRGANCQRGWSTGRSGEGMTTGRIDTRSITLRADQIPNLCFRKKDHTRQHRLYSRFRLVTNATNCMRVYFTPNVRCLSSRWTPDHRTNPLQVLPEL